MLYFGPFYDKTLIKVIQIFHNFQRRSNLVFEHCLHVFICNNSNNSLTDKNQRASESSMNQFKDSALRTYKKLFFTLIFKRYMI